MENNEACSLTSGTYNNINLFLNLRKHFRETEEIPNDEKGDAYIETMSGIMIIAYDIYPAAITTDEIIAELQRRKLVTMSDEEFLNYCRVIVSSKLN